MEDYGEYLFINARGIDYTVDKDVLQIADLSMFMGPNYVVTVHNIDMPSVRPSGSSWKSMGGPWRGVPHSWRTPTSTL